MATTRPFQHLPLPLRYRGNALIRGGGNQATQTRDNRTNYASHASTLRSSAASASGAWQRQQADREREGLPEAPKGMPVLLQVDPNLDLDALREKFGFEIVSEQEDGFVIVASEDISLTALVAMINSFATDTRGSATIARIHRLFDDPTQEERLKRILSESLYQAWPTIRDDQKYICDIGICGLGATEIPYIPNRGKRDSDADWARKEAEWSRQRSEAYQAWDDLKMQREEEISRYVEFYGGGIINIIDGAAFDTVRLPDSFTVRVKLTGKGLRDVVLNYSYIFEVEEPEDIELPQRVKEPPPEAEHDITPQPPAPGAPVVCVIDSGIQEEHRLIAPAIDSDNSHCFLPGLETPEVADYVRPGGHGTRVAGAVLYGETIPTTGQPSLECWIQNARVLDGNCSMPA